VILDELPPGHSLADRVVEYVSAHRGELRWDGSRRDVLTSLRDGAGWLREHATEFVTTLDGRDYVHAYYDGHADWRKRRLDGPYVVASPTESKVLAEPIPYVDLASECGDLPAPEKLRTVARQPRHNRRLLPLEAAAYLRRRVEDSRAWNPRPQSDPVRPA
jgi:hypothetical protein